MSKKAFDKLTYCNIKMKRIKIEGARIHNNRMFQEGQEIFCRKTLGTKQWKGT